ncbi:hypothetical protein COLO4_19739 [Corchorus olitorius]|uniref:Pentatricopeptide repeat-containing protein n=1 Tax=Corchorus olitorius TaxID=93759 RepID=A0A1R3J3T0_9ROSI|nr:hypothetical protein COLO4_19739 [Corchorus olitorius]
MMLRGVRPDKHTLPRVLTASRLCTNVAFGKQVHAHAFKLGLSSDLYIITALMEMYGRLDGVDVAKWVLDNAPTTNSVAWTILAKLYLMDNKPHLAIEIFNQMLPLKADIDPVGLATAIGACSLLKSRQQAKKLHQIAKECGLESHILVGNSLLKMYVGCDSIEEAQSVFEAMPSKDVISWTQMIHGHVKKGGYNEGLKLFRRMISAGIKPDSFTISSILPACGRIPAHKQGKELHAYLLRNGIDMNLTVQNAVMDMLDVGTRYFNCIRAPTLTHCALMVALLARVGLFNEAQKFMEEHQIKNDAEVLRALLDGCRIHQQVKIGKQIVEQLCELEPLNADNYVLLSNVGCFPPKI